MKERGLVEVSQLGQIFGQVELRRIGFDDLVLVDRHEFAGGVQLEPDPSLLLDRFLAAIADADGGVEPGRGESVLVLEPNSAGLDPFLLLG